MVVQDIFPFTTMTDSCKNVKLMEFFNTIYIFCETLQKVVPKIPYLWENPMKLVSSKPYVTNAKSLKKYLTRPKSTVNLEV